MVDSHQLLQSSLQRLNDAVGAADGASFTATTSDSHARGSGRHRRDDQQLQNLEQQQAASYAPLVKSMKDLADSNMQLAYQREQDRIHEERMEDRREQFGKAGESRKRKFQRRAELLDQARQYRRLNAELDQTDRNSERLSKFYIDEYHALQEEIDALAKEED